jgi:DnaK suppressor protein
MTSTLTSGQRALLQAELAQRRQQLDQQLAEQQGGRSRAEAAADWLNQDGDDAPQRDADREVALARADHELDELGRVSQALQRVQAADFGVCKDCGTSIAFDRLRLEPWALRCVACEAAREAPAARRPHQI